MDERKDRKEMKHGSTEGKIKGLKKEKKYAKKN